jgi:hypothetical protein
LLFEVKYTLHPVTQSGHRVGKYRRVLIRNLDRNFSDVVSIEARGPTVFLSYKSRVLEEPTRLLYVIN